MNRTAQSRRHRRRKAAERAIRGVAPSTPKRASDAAGPPSETEPTSEMKHPADESGDKRKLPFEIAEDHYTPAAGDGPDDHPPPEAATTREPAQEGVDPVESDTQTVEPTPVQAGPSAEDLLYNAAREAHGQGETKRAIAIYRELLGLEPNHVRARNNLGLLLDQNGEHEDALHELQLCLNAEPNNPQVLVNRGGVLGALGRYREAEADLRQALEHDTTNAEAHFNLGLLMSRKGLWAEALPYLRRSIELDSSRATAYNYLGDALNHVDDLNGALQAYQRSVELVPNNGKAFYGLGIIYDRMNKPEEAQQMYRRSRELTGR